MGFFWFLFFGGFLHFEYIGSLPLASKVSNEEYADKFIEDPLHVMSHFSFSVIKIFSLSFKSMITMCLDVSLFEFILEFVELLGYSIPAFVTLGSFQPVFY